MLWTTGNGASVWRSLAPWVGWVARRADYAKRARGCRPAFRMRRRVGSAFLARMRAPPGDWRAVRGYGCGRLPGCLGPSRTRTRRKAREPRHAGARVAWWRLLTWSGHGRKFGSIRAKPRETWRNGARLGWWCRVVGARRAGRPASASQRPKPSLASLPCSPRVVHAARGFFLLRWFQPSPPFVRARRGIDS